MKKRIDLLIVLLVYVSALIIGVIAFRNTPLDSVILRLLVADVIATTWVFGFSTAFRNSSIYDPYWSVAPLALVWAFIDLRALDLSTLLVLVALYAWGIRLTANWIYTFSGFDHQDWRYDHYKSKSGALWPVVNYAGIHMLPTLVVFVAMLPVFLLLQAPGSAGFLTFVAAMLALGCVLLQLISDIQMHRHRRANPGQVMDQGLWKWSRHPNYFGEIAFWFMLYAMMLSVTGFSREWIAGLGPLANLVLFLVISIPLMEKRQLSRRPAYAEYMQRTSALIPIPPSMVRLKREA